MTELEGAPSSDTIQPLCADVETWVAHIYVTTYIRRTSQTVRWCAQWWAHAEAIVRLSAMWRSWESSRLSTDPEAMARWLRDVLDPLNRGLLDPDGPFSSCNPTTHTDQAPLAQQLAPAGYWDIDAGEDI